MKPVYIRTDKNGTEYWADYTCKRCGGAGGADSWLYTGWTCYECGGTGKVDKPEIIKKYTPEYEKKLNERREKRQEKKRLEKIKEIWEHMDEVYISHGFSSEGKLWAVIEPNSFDIKEELKATGAKWNPILMRWAFVKRPEQWETVEIRFEELYNISEEWGTVYRNDIDGKELVLSKIPKKENESKSEYVGEIGKRLEISLTLKGTRSWAIQDRFSYYGGMVTQVMYLFEDTEGNVLIWKTTGYGLDANKYHDGDTLVIKGTVKDHKEYKGVKQTILQRVKVVA